MGWTSSSRIEKSTSWRCFGSAGRPCRGSSSGTQRRTGVHHRANDPTDARRQGICEPRAGGPWPSIFCRRKANGRAKKCPTAPDTQALQGIGRMLFVHLVSDQRLSEKQILNMRKLLESKSDTGRLKCCPGALFHRRELADGLGRPRA